MSERLRRRCAGLERTSAGAASLWPVLGTAESSLKAIAGQLDDGRVLHVPGPARSVTKLRCAPVPVRPRAIP
jgi:hypothetical protein